STGIGKTISDSCACGHDREKKTVVPHRDRWRLGYSTAPNHHERSLSHAVYGFHALVVSAHLAFPTRVDSRSPNRSGAGERAATAHPRREASAKKIAATPAGFFVLPRLSPKRR